MVQDFPSETSKLAAEQAEIKSELARVLASASFRKSVVLARLLKFLVEQDLEGNGRSLKETYIGHVLYQRDATYDPRIDPIVRVSANRLRARLQEYYAQNPQASLRLEIPRGSYTPVYHWTRPPELYADASDEIEQQTSPVAEISDSPEMAVLDTLPESLPPSIAPPVSGSKVNHYVVVAAMVVIIVAALSFALTSRGSVSRRSPVLEWKAKPFSRLGGSEEFPAFSPDGNRVAFSWRHSTPRPSVSFIYVQELGSSIPTRLTDDDGENTRPAWSPDGSQLAFVHRTDAVKELRVIDIKGRHERKVADLVGSFPWLCQVPRVSWSHDGAQLITANSATAEGSCGIVSIDLRSGQIHPITQPSAGTMGDLEPAVSLKGDRIAFIRSAGTLAADIYTMDRDGRDLIRVTHDNRDIIGFSWDSADSGFVLSSRREDGVGRLWHTTLAGVFARLTEGTSFPAFPSMNPDGSRIVFSLYHNLTSIWRVTASNADRLIADSGSDGDAQTSPDGKTIAFRSDRTGAFELWLADRDGANIRRLTYFNGPMVNGPAWSPNGHEIAFQCRDRGNTDLCTIPASGGPVRHLTNWTSDQVSPSWSADGNTVFFSSNHSGKWEIYKLRQGESQPEAITTDGGLRAVPLRDGGGLLVSRGNPTNGIYCGPAAGTEQSFRHCRPGSLLLPLDSERIQGMWDAAPRGFWFVHSAGTNTSELASFDMSTGQVSRINTFPGKLVPGDRALSVEPTGNSALVVKQDVFESQLEFLEAASISAR